MQFSLERLSSDTDLQISNDKHEWAKIYTPVSLLTQRAVLTSSSDDLAFILHFKKLKQYQQLSWVIFPPLYL